ncbi:MAG: hypothetical protein ABWX96_02075 [Propionibacteriaceae bacterium]
MQLSTDRPGAGRALTTAVSDGRGQLPAAGTPDLMAGQDSWAQAGWLRTERLLAVAVTVVLAMRIVVLQQILLTAGDLLVFGLTPLWFGTVRRYASARVLLLLGVAAAVFGGILSIFSASDHVVRVGQFGSMTVLMLGLLAGFGFLLWAREKLGDAVLATVFGLGLLIGVSGDGALYSSNPWRFGFSVAVTVLALGLCHLTHRRGLELVVVVALCLVSALTDARSTFAILLLTATLLAWQARPLRTSRRGSAMRGALGLAVVAALVYNIGQALILNGLLGAKTQQRSIAQVDRAGSLILGGRPEIAATLSLLRDHIWGYGSGTIPNLHDINVAKAGMRAINYDPDNGYVEDYMFGHGYSLHSVAGELWALFGILGVAFAVAIMVVVLKRLGLAVTSQTASAILLYVSLKTIWNLLFAPWYSSLAILMLTLALVVAPSARSAAATEATEDTEQQQPAAAS